ncbi:unnamed protein product, partial [Litomosoides sigmodontis]
MIGKGAGHELGNNFNQSLVHVLRRICSSTSVKMENDNSVENKVRFRKKKRLFCNICEPHRAVGMLLVDWIFLAGLGVAMAVLSLMLDYGVDKLQTWSGIPEVKTILQGVHLDKHLTFRTLISKLIGLMLAIGSGFPIGKEGPFVHMGSIVAHLMRRLVEGIKPAYANESRSYELLAAGCAAGVAATFSAPVGGVLFSIEVTTAYFAVRDYWRGFFAAACSAAAFSLLRLWINPFEAPYVDWPVRCSSSSTVDTWIVYPLTISVFYSTITYPHGLGQYLTGQIVFARSLRDFFANCTWHVNPLHAEACNEFLVMHWKIFDSVFIELGIFIVGFYFLVIVANTLPVPTGIFMPAFVIGAAMGRLIGELMAFGYPNGFRNNQQLLVLPGIYSVISVLLSNIVCSSLQPSFFDSIIKIKHLPYFPDIPKSTSWVHEIRVEQIMVKNVKFLTRQSTYYELQELLSTLKIMAYPLVDNPSSMILLGSVSRENLLCLLNQIVGDEARHAEYLRRTQLQRKFHGSAEDEIYKDRSLANFPTAPVFRNTSLAKVRKHPTTEDLQRPLTGALEVCISREPKLKASVGEYAVREGSTERERMRQLHLKRDFRETLGSVLEKITQTFRTRKREELEDLNKEERQVWEKQQLSREINYSFATIDPAPFQLVEDTSLYKVHSIFSLLGIRQAYVTKCGTLVGVVAAKEVSGQWSVCSVEGIEWLDDKIASAIERMQAGTLTAVTKRAEDDERDKRSATKAALDLLESSESDTDNEDIILPRVEFDKTTSSEILETQFAALQASIGREVANRDRRKSYPNFPGKSCRSLRVPKYATESCDIILEKMSGVEEQLPKQAFGHVAQNHKRLQDSVSKSALSSQDSLQS